MLSHNDYKVLFFMHQYDCVNEVKSLTVNELAELTKLSISKVRKSIYMFKEIDYIKEGVLKHNAKTYYVSEEGNKKVVQLLA